ncbi:MAG: DNA/RNA non-specific endonuclease [Thermoleophilia bacterium]|nr:DNA/RNA non-specific endonuclease [Thermoleophilia bacterium]
MVDGFLAGRAAKAAARELPDIAGRFSFRRVERDGKVYREAAGRLGVPGQVKVHRDKGAQRALSAGTGDDAGHLIGNRFGAPGGADNLGLQNLVSNRGGSYKQLEDSWAKKLEEGAGIEVKVTDVTIKGKYDDRPFMRRVEWTEVAPDGTRKTEEMLFHNAQWHPPKGGGAPADAENLIYVDFVKKRPIP